MLAFGYYPKAEQEEPITQLADAPLLNRQNTFKVLSYNVQFMAGKDYTFWFGVPEANGPDSHASADAVQKTLAQVAHIITDEDADFVFLQEVDDGAKRTGKKDQLQALLELLPATYAYHTHAF